MRRLIVKLSSIGDVVHTIPAFHAIRRQAPRDHLAWIVEEPAFPILDGLEGLDESILLPRRRWLSRWTTAGEALDLLGEIRRMRYDQVIDFQGLARSALVALASGAPQRVGFADGREGSYLAYTHRVDVGPNARHAVERNLSLVRAIGAPAESVEPRLTLPRTARHRVRKLVDERGLSGGFVVLHPSAGRATNRYPPDRFSAVGDRIAADLGLEVVVTGSVADRPLAGEVIGGMRKGGVDLSGRLHLWELAALSRISAAFVGGDTGPLHLAAAVGAKVVGIYAGASPEKTGPYARSARIVRSRFPCGPCYRRSCPDLPCMEAISPGDVFEQVREHAEGSASPEVRRAFHAGARQ